MNFADKIAFKGDARRKGNTRNRKRDEFVDDGYRGPIYASEDRYTDKTLI